MASTKAKILTKKISLSHETTKGGGGRGADPFVVKDYEKGSFFKTSLKLLIRIIFVLER